MNSTPYDLDDILLDLILESKYFFTHKGHPHRYNDVHDYHTKLGVYPSEYSLLRQAFHQSSRSKLNTLKRHYQGVLRGIIVSYLDSKKWVSSELKRHPDRKIKGPSFDDFSKQVKDVFKQMYFDAYRLGIEGSGATLSVEPTLSDEDKRWVESALIHEFRFLNRFLDDIENDTLSMPWERRLSMYVDTLDSIYSTARLKSSHGDSLYYWMLRPAEHCVSCLFLYYNSPYTANTLVTVPKAGATVCLTNCKCYIRIVKSDPHTIARVEARSRSRDSIYRHLLDFKKSR